MSAAEQTLDQEVGILKSIIVGLIAADDGIAALQAASVEKLSKKKGERDTAFVKRIAKAYIIAALKHELYRLEATL